LKEIKLLAGNMAYQKEKRKTFSPALAVAPSLWN
jgi:hypothetical protein